MQQRTMKTVAELVAAAQREIEELSPQEAIELSRNPGVLLVDIRDPRELKRDGMIPDAFHCPRGMLEFWIDPQSPYYKGIFGTKRKFVFYCATGWRSALATKTAQDMGLNPVAHINGGFKAWKEAGGPVESVDD